MPTSARERDGIRILRPEGDLTTGPHLADPRDSQRRPIDELREAIEDLLEKDACGIVLDLERVKFIDSAGLAELIHFKKRALHRGGDLKLLRPGRHVHDVLVQTSLTEVFEVFQDEDQVVASFRSA